MKIALINSEKEKCEPVFNFLSTKLNLVDIERSDVIICLGGDGFLLHTLHQFHHLNKALYGINCGNLGFLMNDFNLKKESPGALLSHIKNAKPMEFNPLEVTFEDSVGNLKYSLAFNEVSVLRADGTAAHLAVKINNEIKLPKLVSDGILLATPMGSTAYNKACGGALLPLQSNLLALTGINSFHPTFFKGAVILGDSEVEVINLSPSSRKINLFCDFIKYENIVSLKIKKSTTKHITLLFNQENNLAQKTLNSQFLS